MTEYYVMCCYEDENDKKYFHLTFTTDCAEKAYHLATQCTNQAPYVHVLYVECDDSIGFVLNN